jgi:4-hydroxybenzoyl-CoA thioesterase
MPYTTTIIVRFGDVDSAGIVYYPRYPHYLHVGMERFFEEALGVDYAELTVERKFGLPTVRLEVDYRRPFRYGDRILMDIEIGSIGTTSVEWLYTLRSAGEETPRATARTVTVASDLERLAKVPVPDWLRSGLEARVRPDRPGR